MSVAYSRSAYTCMQISSAGVVEQLKQSNLSPTPSFFCWTTDPRSRNSSVHQHMCILLLPNVFASRVILQISIVLLPDIPIKQTLQGSILCAKGSGYGSF